MSLKATDLSPDLVLLNGRIFTLDASNTTAQAVGVENGRIRVRGSDAEISAME
jgi:predicted amidohydrolase YtcJ